MKVPWLPRPSTFEPVMKHPTFARQAMVAYVGSYGLADRFYNVVYVADHPLWNGCTKSQLGVAELVDIKADGYISERIYDRISQWANRILPPDHTLYKLFRERDPHQKKSPHALLRNKTTFTQNRAENKVARPRLTGDQILEGVENISPAVETPLSLPSGYGSDHKWMKKNIFWDLPYWSMLLIQRKFDVMHIEKNVIDNILNTVVEIKGKTKDNMNAYRDLKIICDNRLELELDGHRLNIMRKAVYTLAKEQKIRSHDCHVFMQTLIPIAFCVMLSEHVWSALTEGRGCGYPSPPWAEPADPASATPLSESVSQPSSIPADSGTVGSTVAGASSSHAPARSWEAPPPPAPVLPPQAQRHYINLQDARALSASLANISETPAILVPEVEGIVGQEKGQLAADPKVAATVYHSGSSSVGAHKHKLQLAVGKEAEYSVLAPRLTTRLLDHHAQQLHCSYALATIAGA
ncbi:hypothetical protein Sango_1181300 [Sesamum angolense]|uniref:Uncharacterized protein n=1 Tax=Sesamum angolense TaxID=2727404 RepID=A0AAE1WX64_9LAMI|nr:hypothetical protein Sango_1181300 [Sesamum angolense]